MQKFIRQFSNSVLVAALFVAFSGCSRQQRANRHESRANGYFDAGQYDKAEIEYVNVLHYRQDDAQAWARLATIYYEEGRFSPAVPILRRASELAPSNLDLHLKLGTLFVSAGKTKEGRDEAIYVLNAKPQDNEAPLILAEAAADPKEIEAANQRLQALSQKSDSAAIEVGLGTLCFRKHDLKMAEDAFNKAESLDSKFAATHSALGTLYLSQHDLKRADSEYKSAADLSPIRSARRIQYAKFKIQIGDPAAAKAFLEDISHQAPDYLPATLALANLAAGEKRYDDCATLIEKILNRDPNNYDALLLRGRVKVAKRQFADAVAEFEKLAKIYPQAPNVWYQLAVASLANDETANATINVARALALQPDFSDAILLQASLQVKQDNFAPAIISLRQLIQQQPQLAEPRLLLAEAYSLQGSHDEALNVYRELEKAFPHNPEAPWLTGVVYLQETNSNQARQAFNRALSLSPDYVPALEQLVRLDIADKQYDNAMERAQSQIAKHPTLPEPLLLEAAVFVAQKNTNQAEASLLKAIQIKPDYQEAYILLAHLYVNSKDNRKALQDLQTALAKDPRDISALMLIGQIHDAEKDPNAARDAYEKLLAIKSDFSPALNNLAYLYSEYLGDLDKAYDAARRARELLPYDPSTADTLGWVLFKKEQYPAALNLLQESAKNLPPETDPAGKAEVEFHLGMVHYMLGQEDQAREAFQTAIASSEDFTGKEECRSYLTVLAIDPQSAGPEIRANLEKRLAEHPDDPVVLARLAAIYQKNGSLDKAINAYEAALKQNPRDAHLLIRLTRLYVATSPGNLQKPLNLARNAYKLAPDDDEVLRTLGPLAFQSGDYKWSLTLLQQSAEAHPNDPQILFELAQASYSTGDVPGAEASMRTALKSGLDRGHLDEAQRFLEMLALAADSTKAARESPRLNDLLKTNPNNVPILMAAAAGSESSDPLASQQMYEKALIQYPDFTPARKRLAALYLADPAKDQKTYALALKASAVLPQDPELQRILGIVAYRQGDYPRASRLLDQSAANTKGDAELVYYLGMAQYRAKDLAASKTTLKQALAMNLPAKLASDAKQVLAQLK